MRRYLVPVLFVVVLISIGINVILAWGLAHRTSEGKLQERYPLLARRILIDNPNDILINFVPLRKSLNDVAAPWGDSFAMYFEYLPTGTSIGVNSTNEFIIASLVKVPVAMAYYRKQERLGMDFLDNVATIQAKDIDQSFGDLWRQGAGTKITVREALRQMLVLSDNTAANIIATTIPPEDFTNVFAGLDMNLQEKDGKTIISAKGYASILKALYFAAIINEDHSEQILNLLTQSSFNDQLVAGVPQNIKVAHKIGVYNNLYQDCGIVYVPDRPYLLCMMSETPKDEADKRMSAVSRTVYTYVVGANESDQSDN